MSYSKEELISCIIRYMKDETARYAIAMEGEWGSGKTLFCNTDLRRAIAINGFVMVRLSLFGIGTPDELYKLLLSSLLQFRKDNEDNDSDDLVHIESELIEGLLKSIIDTVNMRLQSSKLRFSLDSSLLIHLMTMKAGAEILLVFDDVERHRFSNDMDLFGIINNLVENQGCKVLFVTSNIEELGSELREKLIWRCYSFCPNPCELADDVLIRNIDPCSMLIDYSSCIEEAAEKSKCRNARAMIKSLTLIHMIINSSPAQSANLNTKVLKKAVTDVIVLVLSEATGFIKKQIIGKLYDDRELTIEEFDSFSRIEEYDILDVVHHYFSAHKNITQDDVNAALYGYIEHKYPDAFCSAELFDLFDEYNRLGSMDEIEARFFASKFYSSFFYIDIDIKYMLLYVRRICCLYEYGLLNDASPDTVSSAFVSRLRKRCMSIIEIDIETSNSVFETESLTMMIKSSGGLYNVLFNELRQYVQKKYSTYRESCGFILSHDIYELVLDDYNLGNNPLVHLKPSVVAEAFVLGDYDKQSEIVGLIGLLDSFRITLNTNSLLEWSLNLLDDLQIRIAKTHMQSYNIGRLTGQLQTFIDSCAN